MKFDHIASEWIGNEEDELDFGDEEHEVKAPTKEELAVFELTSEERLQLQAQQAAHHSSSWLSSSLPTSPPRRLLPDLRKLGLSFLVQQSRHGGETPGRRPRLHQRRCLRWRCTHTWLA
eukprot:Colp12_sorted_trinity150504_noHs@16887